MLLMRNLIYFTLLNSLTASVQINLYLTDSVSDDNLLQHSCLHVAISNHNENNPYEIITYCMNEWPSNWTIQNNSFDQMFTFNQLAKLNITSQQLYHWSGPIDVVERYQFYLNHLGTSSDDISMGTQVFYNCTLPRFGPMCQYSFDYYQSNHSSLYDIVHDFYFYNNYVPIDFTCYTHLKCHRGPSPTCLDWSEVCDGKVDCLDGGLDEEYCWQLEINNCGENEYRCINGQCISRIFFRDKFPVPDCLDASDEVYLDPNIRRQRIITAEPSFAYEDFICPLYQPHTDVHTLTSSCVYVRSHLLWQAIFSKPKSVSDDCWFVFSCLFYISYTWDRRCNDFCLNEPCNIMIQKSCPDLFFIPTVPLPFGHLSFLYTKNSIENLLSSPYLFLNICYNDQVCNEISNTKTFLFNNITCRHPQDFPTFPNHLTITVPIPVYLASIYKHLETCKSIVQNDSMFCNQPNVYRCFNSSKCISTYHLHDKIKDCYYGDDEDLDLVNDPSSSFKLLKNHFKCRTTNEYIPQYMVGNENCNCKYYGDFTCDDEFSEIHYSQNHISFQTICDGFTDLLPITIDGKNETDETGCNRWICNNTYTRCDGIWNCFDGADEVDCDSSPLLTCPLHHHICISSKTNQIICLPITKANDGTIDCLGGSDEPSLCRANLYGHENDHFYCKNNISKTCLEIFYLCSRRENCMYGDDEQFCQKRNTTAAVFVCDLGDPSWRSDIENLICKRFEYKSKQPVVHFSLDQINHATEPIENMKILEPSLPKTNNQSHLRCHRGLDLRVWLNGNSNSNITTTACLCPPSFYGNICQYQNQRVSLTVLFRALSNSLKTTFAIVASLIDDDGDHRTIHSSQQFTYLPIRDCQIKFNIYLVYSTRSKNLSKHYTVHIDIYEKISLIYHGSLLIPLNFSFLPVHRLALQLDIPRINDDKNNCSSKSCIHGHCIRYSNSLKGQFFCQCKRGWTGRYCTIPYNCTCSSDSLCTGVLANNRSLCVCPNGKFGPRCLLNNGICQVNKNITCLKGGQCVPVDEHMAIKRKFICICQNGFSGEKCEIPAVKLVISFHKDISLPQSMLIHFIRVNIRAAPENAIMFKAIPVNQDAITIYWSQLFHIAFIELFNKSYYLTAVQKKYIPSINITKTLSPSDQCPHIREIFNQSIAKLNLLRRIKYYHLPCQRSSPNLSCFYDDIHFCLCDTNGHQRLANCFEFNHEMKRDCLGRNGCENGAQCFQDDPTCPQTSICVCSKCFYGGRCQFSMNGFELSLDAILGYHIQPYVSIIYQPIIVQISAILSMIMVIIGLINGILSFITFKNKKPREVGCGYFLSGSSITTILTMIMLAIKFWILISSQMGQITNRLFLYFQCRSVDFILRICLNMNHWLNAFVAIERAVVTIKGTSFNKAKSKRRSKYMIVILLILMIITNIHDPIYRRLIDSENSEENRTWCIITYPSWLATFHSAMNSIHFFIPFMSNLISAIIIIWKNARHEATMNTNRSFIRLLCEQFRQYKHLLTASILITILAIPRLIISVVSGCMKSSRDSWPYLIGYFVSFIPSMLTFVFFIQPSKLYKEEYRQTMARFRTKLQVPYNNFQQIFTRMRYSD